MVEQFDFNVNLLEADVIDKFKFFYVKQVFPFISIMRCGTKLLLKLRAEE